MNSKNTSDNTQAQALNKTDVSGSRFSSNIQCCGIFPTNDCSECSHFKQMKKQSAIDKIDSEYNDRNSPHYKDNERYKWAINTINERFKTV